jgi:hypothetical protein
MQKLRKRLVVTDVVFAVIIYAVCIVLVQL